MQRNKYFDYKFPIFAFWNLSTKLDRQLQMLCLAAICRVGSFHAMPNPSLQLNKSGRCAFVWPTDEFFSIFYINLFGSTEFVGTGAHVGSIEHAFSSNHFLQTSHPMRIQRMKKHDTQSRYSVDSLVCVDRKWRSTINPWQPFPHRYSLLLLETSHVSQSKDVQDLNADTTKKQNETPCV